MGNLRTKQSITGAIFIIGTVLALFLGGRIPLLGSSIAAILLGFLVRHSPLYEGLDRGISKFISSHMLKTGIVILGFTLSMRILGQVGWRALLVIIAVIVTANVISYYLGQRLGIPHKLKILIGMGSSICGGAAISTISPVIEAKEDEIAMAISTTFLYSMMALLLFPLIGQTLQMTDQVYGIFAGTAVNDTASVVAASFDWSQRAGAVATIVKLVRTLFIVPLTLGILIYQAQDNSGHAQGKINWGQVKKSVPQFVIYFIAAVSIASVFVLPESFTHLAGQVSKFFMTMGLFAIGLGVHIDHIKRAGVKPMILGGVSWFMVVLVALTLISFLY